MAEGTQGSSRPFKNQQAVYVCSNDGGLIVRGTEHSHDLCSETDATTNSSFMFQEPADCTPDTTHDHDGNTLNKPKSSAEIRSIDYKTSASPLVPDSDGVNLSLRTPIQDQQPPPTHDKTTAFSHSPSTAISDLQEAYARQAKLSKENEELKEKLTKALLRNENFKSKNHELEKENERLNKENDIQADRYVKLRIENDELKKLRTENEELKKTLEKYDAIFDGEVKEDPATEQQLQLIIQKNMQNFTKFTNLSSLLPFLIAQQLVTPDESDDLSSKPVSSRNNHFYTRILPSKGSKAHLTFRRCLADAVNDTSSCHKGHIDLLKLLNQLN